MGIDRYVYSVGDATYTAMITRLEKQSKGFNAVSLSNYDATGVCVITDGSTFEIGGSMYLCTTDTSITASVATGICYIMATGATATATVAWSTTAPVWRDDYQGYYASAASSVRAIGGTYFDGSSYELKWVYTTRHTGPLDRSLIPALDGSAGYTAIDDIAWQGSIAVIDAANGNNIALGLRFPRYAFVTGFTVICTAYTAGTLTTDLRRSSSGTSSALASVNVTSAATFIDSTIVDPIIDEDTYNYFVRLVIANNDDLTLGEIDVSYTEIVRY